MISAAAKLYIGMLVAFQVQYWPSAYLPSFMASMVEAESRWNPNAQLKSDREWGTSFGQWTTAYNKDGSVRFNAWADVKKAHPDELKGWADRFEPAYNLKAVVLSNRSTCKAFEGLGATPDDVLRMCVSAHNGGAGSVRQDRLKCRMTPGCDPTRWRGNVEATSYKSSQPSQYGRSYLKINRDYVVRVVDEYRPKYDPYFRSAQ
jgi:hypothetical protein